MDFNRRGNSGRSGDRQMHKAVCGNCGDNCEVPFKPSGDKPVLCSNCFEKSGNSRSSNSRGSDRRSDRGFNRRPDRFGSSDRQMHKAVCDKCGNDCEVPFKPSSDKPVFCSDCFEKGNATRGGGGSISNDQLEALSEKLDQIIELLSPKIKKSSKAKVDELEEKKIAKPKKTAVKKEAKAKKAPAKKKVAKKPVKKTATKKSKTKK